MVGGAERVTGVEGGGGGGAAELEQPHAMAITTPSRATIPEAYAQFEGDRSQVTALDARSSRALVSCSMYARTAAGSAGTGSVQTAT